MKPKVLLIDIETAPILADVWQLYDVNVGLNQIRRDWSILAWSAKWLSASDDDVIYQDTSQQRDKFNDKKILGKMWKLLDEADVVVGQNSKRFDVKKLNARFAYHDFQPYSSFRHIDTRQMAKSRFGFTSNSLEYLAKYLNVKYQKLTQRQFVGQDLWTACIENNPEAWKEMKMYNQRDVLALQGVYQKLIPWDSSVSFNVYEEGPVCTCGGHHFKKRGFFFTNTGKYQRFKCLKCGKETRSGHNLLSKETRRYLQRGTAR